MICSCMKTYVRSAVVSLGFFAGTLLVDAQTGAGGGAAGGGAAGAGATGAGAAGPGVSSARVGSSGAVSASGAAGGRVSSEGLNTIGSAGISQPANAPLVGGASTIEGAPNNIGGAQNTGGITASPNTAPGAAGTLPSGVPTTTTTVPFNTLPPTVQSTLQGFSANGALGSVTPVPGRAGTFRARVTQNGVPVELMIAPNGQIVSRTPVPGNFGAAPTADIAANVQAGVPLTSLPPAVRNSIQSQLGGAAVQSISRDDLANGSVLRVTALQNGVPTEFRFAANGALLGTAPVTGTATSAFVPGGALVPGSAVLLDDLPGSIQTAIRGQLGETDANRIMQQRTAAGVNYVVSYDENGRPMTMVVGPDGRILSNGPANVGVAATVARGTAATTNDTDAATDSTTMRLDDLPDDVANVLKQRAPYAEVRTITREQRVGGDVYVVAVRDGDRAGEISIDANGKVVSDTRRDLSALTPRAPAKTDEKPQGLPHDELPVAIKNAIKAYATASDIRSITLGLDRDGRTVYDVIYYQDGNRDRLIIAKDGTLVRIEENVSPLLEVDSLKPPVIAIGDLPVEVRDTIRRQTDSVKIDEITTKEIGDRTVYRVKYNTNGAPVELLVSNDGEVVIPEGSLDPEDPTEPVNAAVDREEPSPARIIAPTAAQARAEESRESELAIGASARAETGASVSAPAGPAASTMSLSDAPKPVQNTVSKLAGSSTVQSVSPVLGASGVNYQVTFLKDGKTQTVLIDKDGKVQEQKKTSEP